jgi:L-ascorbate metabolism protein UlaG (beta-lactamase superfamily)
MPKLTFIGHAAFLLEDGAGNTVAIDPLVEHNPATRLTARDITANTILLTHAHNDHVGDTVEIAKNNDAKVICVVELGDWLEEQGVRDVVGVNHGGTVGFAGGTVKIVPAWHSSSFTTENGVVAPGVPAGLVVRFGGRTFYFAGEVVGAKTVIPCHYNTFPPIRQDPEQFRAAVAKRAPGTEVVVLAPGETYEG